MFPLLSPQPISICYIHSSTMRQQVVVVLIVLLSTMVFPPQTSAGGMGSEDPGVTDVVTWRVGDKWVYAGAFDPTVLVQCIVFGGKILGFLHVELSHIPN